MIARTEQDAKTIGARFRSARSLVPDLNRKLFCERHGINRYTMQSWENGLHVSKGKNVWKFIEALHKEGVLCSIEWLFHGKGSPARMLDASEQNTLAEGDLSKNHLTHPHLDVIDCLIKEAAAKNIHLNMLIVQDDLMAPKYRPGDILLGRLLDPDAAPDPYILIESGPHQLTVRRAITHKEQILLLTNNDRLMPTVAPNDAKMYRIVAHFPYFSC